MEMELDKGIQERWGYKYLPEDILRYLEYFLDFLDGKRLAHRVFGPAKTYRYKYISYNTSCSEWWWHGDVGRPYDGLRYQYFWDEKLVREYYEKNGRVVNRTYNEDECLKKETKIFKFSTVGKTKRVVKPDAVVCYTPSKEVYKRKVRAEFGTKEERIKKMKYNQ